MPVVSHEVKFHIIILFFTVVREKFILLFIHLKIYDEGLQFCLLVATRFILIEFGQFQGEINLHGATLWLNFKKH